MTDVKKNETENSDDEFYTASDNSDAASVGEIPNDDILLQENEVQVETKESKEEEIEIGKYYIMTCDLQSFKSFT